MLKRSLETAELQARQAKEAKHKAYGVAARVYVGSLFYSTTKDSVSAAFRPFGTIKTTDVSFDTQTGQHKGFCFVEYDCPEAAMLAIAQMDGFLLDGRALKVARPTSWPSAAPVQEAMAADERNQGRIYISSIHSGFTEEDIMVRPRCPFLGSISASLPLNVCSLSLSLSCSG